MAIVRFWKESTEPANTLVKELPFGKCRELLGVRPSDYAGANPPDFSRAGDKYYVEPQHVFIEVDATEARNAGGAWKAGFYRVRMSPEEASAKLAPSQC